MTNSELFGLWGLRTFKCIAFGALSGALLYYPASINYGHPDGDVGNACAAGLGAAIFVAFIPGIITMWYLFLTMISQVGSAARGDGKNIKASYNKKDEELNILIRNLEKK
jgi:hypothetical protein